MPHRPDYDAATLVPRARILRADATPAERELWAMLRRGKLGARFRRQQPVGPFIVDFYCAAVGLVVELDGAGHAAQTDYDSRRTAWLAARGLTVLRFANAEVMEKPQDVYVAILTALRTLTPALRATPLPQGERGELKEAQ
ncbi:MAG: DNA methyltransferase [Alphaproteobacteria bacterium PA4]|nr:MAG: DNA methyltransferase [Alphaproteobacteria bacterium PA4]